MADAGAEGHVTQRRQRQLRRQRRRAERAAYRTSGQPSDRFGRVFLLLVIMFLVGGVERPAGQVLTGLLLVAALLASSQAIGLRTASPKLYALAVAGLAGVIFSYAASLGSKVWAGLAAICASILLAVLLVGIVARILRHQRVTMQTLYGASSAYLLIGTLFAAFYGVLDAFSPNPVFNVPVSSGDLSYFSFVTMLTIGYGDIVPVAEMARRLVIIEGFSGQLFLATFVARLVSLYGQELRETRHLSDMIDPSEDPEEPGPAPAGGPASPAGAGATPDGAGGESAVQAPSQTSAGDATPGAGPGGDSA